MVTVYVDLLIVLNMIVDFFIILATMALTHTKCRLWREIAAAAAGALFSLYIFLPQQNFLVDMLLRILPSVAVILICCGFKNLKAFLRRAAVFYAVSFLYAGIMLGIWLLIKPYGVVINNGVVYFDFSPLVLIAATLVCYAIISVIGFFAKRHNPTAQRVEIGIEYSGATVRGTALVDTGNSLKDIFTNSPVVVAGKGFAEKIFGAQVCESARCLTVGGGNSQNFRIIPYSTVGGDGVLPALRCERLYIYEGDSRQVRINPIVAITKDSLGEDYDAIINPEIL